MDSGSSGVQQGANGRPGLGSAQRRKLASHPAPYRAADWQWVRGEREGLIYVCLPSIYACACAYMYMRVCGFVSEQCVG